MARRPYFSGNYGSALGSTANAANLLARAGETQGKMFANMGAQVGGMIQQYGLNKEKQKENEGFIKSQSGMLDMLAGQDPEMASQYSAMKEQLNNPDVPLATRAEFGKNLVNNITLSTQLKGQRLLQETQAQTLEEQKRTAELRQNLLQQKSDLNKIVNNIKSIDLANLEELSPLQRKETIARLQSSINLISSEEAAKKATNELTTETAQASKELLPLQTSDKKEELTAMSRERDILDEIVDQSGGIKGMARRQVEATDLKAEATKQEIENKKVLANYYQDVGLAKKLEAVGKLNPSLKQQLSPLTKMQSDLLSTKVAVPGEGQTRITLSEYLELNKKDDTKYPLNGIPQKLLGILQDTDKQIEGALSKQLVDVYVPDEITNQPTDTSASAVPAYQQAINRSKKNTQQEYMNTENVGGAGFPFMP